MLGLARAEGDPGDLCAVMLGGEERESAPTAADVEDSLTWSQSELAAEMMELRSLGIL